MEMRHAQRLRIVDLFKDLADADLARVAETCSIREYERQAQVVGDRDRTRDVFFVLAGTVRFNSISQSGREIIFSEGGPGEMFGEFSAIDGQPRSSACIAQTACVIARMPAARFSDLVKRNGTISAKLVELLVVKIRRMSERVYELSALAVRDRVRHELLRMAAAGIRSGQSVVIRPAPTHYEIASRIGSHREAVTREFNRLEEERLVEVSRRHIRIVDIALLEQSGP